MTYLRVIVLGQYLPTLRKMFLGCFPTLRKMFLGCFPALRKMLAVFCLRLLRNQRTVGAAGKQHICDGASTSAARPLTQSPPARAASNKKRKKGFAPRRRGGITSKARASRAGFSNYRTHAQPNFRTSSLRRFLSSVGIVT